MKYFVLLYTLVLCGCHQFSVGAEKNALRIVGPTHLAISAAGESIKFSPELRLTNLTKSAIGISRIGSSMVNAKLQYRFTDEHGAEIPLLRREGPTLVGARMWTILLLPGKSFQWTTNETLVYPKVAKGRYWLAADLEIDPPDPVFEARLSDADKGQIDHTRHVFDSDPLEISVE
ncbi:MAG TPA: hypothetical protein VGM64_21725 [Lacunisphaera sp.]|jgi:hypothetical protein